MVLSLRGVSSLFPDQGLQAAECHVGGPALGSSNWVTSLPSGI